MSLTALELANIAATAGQLGLGGKGVEAIEQFTESVARATVTFGLGEQQVSQYAAQILQIFNIPTDQVENVFSQINELSNNSVASALSSSSIFTVEFESVFGHDDAKRPYFT